MKKNNYFFERIAEYNRTVSRETGAFFDEAEELPNVMIMGHSVESSLTELMKRSFASDTDVKFLPFPNGEKE